MLALAIALCLVVAACGSGGSDAAGNKDPGTSPSEIQASTDGKLEIRNVRIDEPVNGITAAVRMEIANGTDKDDRLVAASSPVAGLASLHTSGTDSEGRSEMLDLTAVPIPADKVTTFKTGGLHVMLERFDEQDLQVGDKVKLTLKFANAGTRTVTAEVVPIGSGGGPEHEMDHDMDHSVTN